MEESSSPSNAAVSSPPSLFLSIGSETMDLDDSELRCYLVKFLDALGERDDVLILPPDFTRFHSQAGKITRFICEYYKFIPETQQDDKDEESLAKSKQQLREEKADDNHVAAVAVADDMKESGKMVPKIEILPALGTHAAMTTQEIHKMFGEELAKKHAECNCFLVHDWRNDVVTVGEAPPEMIQKATRGVVNRAWPAQLNKKVWEKRQRHDPDKPRRSSLVLSIGQVVPHEVMGMANFNKNLFVGTGGVQAINLSHFIGAVHGMENMMGRKNNPLRDILNYASEHFLENQLDLWYILTVVSADPATGKLCIRGLFIGRDIECYSQACDLSLKVNFTIVEQPIQRCVVYLDPEEFHSTWLGNKAIYRTRMAMADGGRLYILAPGVKRFGEDGKVDELIRKYGYKGTDTTMKSMEQHPELQDNLSAVAHLIHGSSEGRFHITYCPGYLTKQEVEQVGFDYADLQEMMNRFHIHTLKDGWNTDDDGMFYYISNPALGLWAVKSRLSQKDVQQA